MKVKEKAEDLVNKFAKIQEQIEWTKDKELMKLCGERNDELGDEGEYYWKQLAKNSALIAVSEMLINDGWSSSRDEWERFTIYWNDVKYEITQL
jgi:hypothetical protein